MSDAQPYGAFTGMLALLATWRLTHLLSSEDGPWDVIVRLRRRAGDGPWGELLDCFYCLSLWIAAPLAVLGANTWRDGLVLWWALSGGACLLERASGERRSVGTARLSHPRPERGEGDHGLLR